MWFFHFIKCAQLHQSRIARPREGRDGRISERKPKHYAEGRSKQQGSVSWTATGDQGLPRARHGADRVLRTNASCWGIWHTDTDMHVPVLSSRLRHSCCTARALCNDNPSGFCKSQMCLCERERGREREREAERERGREAVLNTKKECSLLEATAAVCLLLPTCVPLQSAVVPLGLF